MQTDNLTPFPAQLFEAIDQHGQPFHVAVLRQTLSFESGALRYAKVQAPLCERTETHAGAAPGSVRQESDYCAYKPRCDVIINATAYAPGGQASALFAVRLTARRPDTPIPLPERPAGLSPVMGPSAVDLARWQARLATIKGKVAPGETLVDKALIVRGPWSFQRRGTIARWFSSTLYYGTLTLTRLCPWRTTKSQPLRSLPIRDEFAYGGQCRINVDDPAARRLPRRYRLSSEQLSTHPDGDESNPRRPVAHTAHPGNPAGRAFVEPWYLRATQPHAVAAPQIEIPGTSMTASDFWRGRRRTSKLNEPPSRTAGYGVRGATHPERYRLAGAIDDTFIDSDAPLPRDFDFAFWNAAPVEQQIDHLHGDEIFELVNLCADDTPGVTIDVQGNTILRLVPSSDTCFLLLRMTDGALAAHPLLVDTVSIEPEHRTVTLVWRACWPKQPAGAMRVCEFRMRRGTPADPAVPHAARHNAPDQRTSSIVAPGRP